MTDWEIIGGDPAPGSPGGVEAAVAAFDKVVSHVEKIRDGLRRAGAEHSIVTWKGEASEKFRSQLKTLPRDLDLIAVSYRQASAALRSYASVLRDRQQDAVKIRESAGQAAADSRRAESERDRCQGEADALESRLRSARAHRDRTQRLYNEATDPAVRSTLSAQLGSARAVVVRLESDQRAAKAARDRHERERRAALERLEKQRRAASVIRERMRQAAESAVGRLERAEKDAQLPGWLTRAGKDTELWVQTYGPVFADTFSKGAEWFSIAAKVLPPGAPIFLTFAAAFGGLSVLSNIAVMTASDDGVTTEEMWQLGGTAMVTIGAVAGLGALTKGASMASIARSATVAKSAGYAKEVTDLGESYAKAGWAGLGTHVTGVVVGYGVGVASSYALKGVVSGMNSNSVTSSWLDAASASVKNTDPRTVKLPGDSTFDLVNLADTRSTQSILGFGRIPPGGFLPAHDGAKELSSHALSAAATDGAFRSESVTELPSWATEEGTKWLAERFGVENTADSITVTLPIRPTAENNESE